MERATLSVTFPQEKLDALEFYMAEKNITVTDELQAHMQSVYEKNIPAATRKYLDRNDDPEEIQRRSARSEQSNSSASNDERQTLKAARREQRKAKKEQKAAEAASPFAPEASAQEALEEPAMSLVM